MITADHGCDPSTPSTDHSREYTPLILYGQPVKAGTNYGTRDTFADIAATILDYFFHCTKMCRKEVRRILGRIRLEPLRQPVKYVTINAIRRMAECAV